MSALQRFMAMLSVPDPLRQRLRQFGQEHVLAWWDRLDDSQRQALLGQIQELDLEQLAHLYSLREQRSALPGPDRIKPVPWLEPTRKEGGPGAAGSRAGASGSEGKKLAEKAWRQGEAAVLIVAGGQGSRLGFEQPKGLFPIGPVSGKSLFQIHSEKVLALGRRYKTNIPLLIMTSPATHRETETFFQENRFFGLDSAAVIFFCQGTMPALDLATGKLLLEAPERLFTSPNGHGGTLTALASSGLLDRLRGRGVHTIFYFQVDNPLVQPADLNFLGRHLTNKAELSAKVVPKESPAEKVGVFAQVDGRLSIIEYSDLPEQSARETDDQGRLRFWAANIAIHLFDVDFLVRVTQDPHGLPWHLARKKVPFLDAQGRLIEPQVDNALKFETFIFDAFPRAERWELVPTSRAKEFVPLKNASGPDSPPRVRQALSNLAADWLEHAGVSVPRQANGDTAWPLEISPLFALDAEELAARIKPGTIVEGPKYFS